MAILEEVSVVNAMLADVNFYRHII